MTTYEIVMTDRENKVLFRHCVPAPDACEALLRTYEHSIPPNGVWETRIYPAT